MCQSWVVDNTNEGEPSMSKRATEDPWIVRLLATKPRLVAAVALANKLARIAWVVMVRQTSFRPAPAAA